MAEVVQIKRTQGACSCGELVTCIENCPFSCRADGARYVYTDKTPDAWNIFRCRGCKDIGCTGPDHLPGFRSLWESTGGDWAANPWVWVIDFKRIERAASHRR